MLSYIGRRLLQLIPLMLLLSVLIFVIIELPPGDYLTMRILELQQNGTNVAEAEIQRLKMTYGLDKSMSYRYFQWVGNMLRHGKFGRSFQWEKPVKEVIGDRAILTFVVAVLTLLLTYVIAIPIGIYASTHQYSIGDYLLTFIGFIGLSVPGFMLALLLLYFSFTVLGLSVTGLFSPEYATAAWSFAKVGDMLKRIWIPILIVGLAGTAGLIRTMRAMMLDELRKQYVVTARAKGVAETKLLFKYPVRVAINPVVSTVGWLLPRIISQTPLVAVVLNLPTLGPILLRSLQYQDMYLAGSILLILSLMTVIGTVMSDIMLVYLDPRIRYGGVGK
jgi:peptide/nickel transport system permease protein